MDRQRLHADLRGAAADRRRARRPLRPPPHVRDRPRHLHARFSRRRAGADDRRADRRPRAAGRRRRDRHAAHADAALPPSRPRSAASRSAPGRASPASASRSARSSAARSSRASRGTGSSGSTCRSASCSPRSPTAAWPSPTAPPASSTCPASRSAALGLLGRRLRHRPRRRAGLDEHDRARRAARRRRRLAAFVAWELRAPAPMLPMRFFRSRAFAASNGVSFAMYFGVFGSIFLLAQFFQVAQGLSPLEAGLRTLPWTAMPMFVAPIAGLLSDRIGSRPLMVAGLTLQATGIALLAAVSSPTVPYSELVHPVRAGRHRHGARVRPDGQRRAQRGPPGGGRPGLGRDQRDPRGRRHARRRRARLGVRAPTAPTRRRRPSPTA